MKKLLLFALFCLPLAAGTLRAQATNAIEKYFSQYLEDDRFSIVYISPKVFQLIDRLDLGDVDVKDKDQALVKDMVKDLRGLRIMSTDRDVVKLYAEARRRIPTNDYEVLMTVRQGNKSKVDFLIHEKPNGIIDELLLLAGGEESFTLISFVGEIDLDKIVRLANELDKDD
ncbi:MAG: DUF4252 domain-containing protein [Saprospiraceae bacterium]